ncbi:hypothetical protein HOP50_06g44840 [Chloropicon primus]|nr:hypothetical protein A3770_06p44610 [Chloropicon primus]UPR01163.1 hypothetical protein HOP50_06g44840 [Chloropicon primus]|eukprot:QDZ21943.1 hypothetical protein A3770_06p44610 [Chloropicon primus]
MHHATTATATVRGPAVLGARDLNAGFDGQGGWTKRQKTCHQEHVSGSKRTPACWKSERTEWGHAVSSLIDDVWKVEVLAQLLRKVPSMGGSALRNRIEGVKRGLQTPENASALEGQISSDEVLAASLVLNTFHRQQATHPAGFGKLSEKANIAPCLSLILEYVYGEKHELSLSDVEGGQALRDIIFRGTFGQASELRRTISSFVGEVITEESCLDVLNTAFSCMDRTLYKKAERFCLEAGLGRVIESSKPAWYFTQFEVVRHMIEAGAKAEKDAPFMLFKHAASWIEHSVHCDRGDAASTNGFMSILLNHIDVSRMKMKEIEHLLDFEPLVQRCSKCIEKLAGAYLHICTGWLPSFNVK